MRKEEEEKGRRGEEEKRRRGENNRIFRFFLLLICVSFVFACKPNSTILNSQRNNQPPANSINKAINSFERDLETMRTADFDYIYVFRRKDGGQMDGEDKRFVKANSPAQTNRFIVSDEEKAIIAGSKFKFAPENLKTLQERFGVEDFSKPAADSVVSPNANMNSNG